LAEKHTGQTEATTVRPGVIAMSEMRSRQVCKNDTTGKAIQVAKHRRYVYRNKWHPSGFTLCSMITHNTWTESR